MANSAKGSLASARDDNEEEEPLSPRVPAPSRLPLQAAPPPPSVRPPAPLRGGHEGRPTTFVNRFLYGIASVLNWLAPFMVRPILTVAFAGILVIAYQLLGAWESGLWLKLGVLGLTAAPNILVGTISFLMTRRSLQRRWSILIPDRDPSGADSNWSERRRSSENTWHYEDELMHASIQRMSRHGTVFGFLASGILTTCAIIALPQRDPNLLRYLIPLTTGTAVFVSFTLNLGKLLFRSASNDATARMMAAAARTLLIVSVTTIFLSTVLLAGTQSSGEAGFSYTGVKGALVIGVATGLIGERVLGVVTDRAATMLGIGSLTPKNLAELNAIDGLSEEDIARLSEERIDSVHALAFTPTPRIFFATTYSLQRICDWQDQALLIDRLGSTKAQILREKYLIKGATEAGRLAASVSDFPALAAALGFNDETQAKRALKQLAREEVVLRLEVLSRSVPCFGPEAGAGGDGPFSLR
jgi:hypothetical protein